MQEQDILEENQYAEWKNPGEYSRHREHVARKSDLEILYTDTM
jgi:hypothetical protein